MTFVISLASFFARYRRYVVFSIVLFALGFFLRSYRISEYLIFLGDEGRDALIVKRMVLDGELTLLGPTASVGGIYLGPIYYYLMVPFLVLFGFDPVGPAVMVAFFGALTSVFVFLLGKRFFGDVAGVVAGLLYAVSPLIIHFSRSSWNPNVLPFFTVFLMWALVNSREARKWGMRVLAGVSLGFCLQLHYLALILIPIVGIVTLFVFRKRIIFYMQFLAGVLLGVSPFLLFELRHGFPNTFGVYRFLFQTKNTAFTGGGTFDVKTHFVDLFVRMFRIFVVDGSIQLGIVVTLVALISIVAGGVWAYRKKRRLGYVVLMVWTLLGVLGLAFYKGQIHDYYYAFLYATPFLILGLGAQNVWSKTWGKGIVLTLASFLFFYNLMRSPIFVSGPSDLLGQTKTIAHKVVELSYGNPYNFALVTDGNSDHAYRYFLELWGKKPTPIDERVESQLIIVCESKKCGPYGNPLFEIAAFGQAQIVEERPIIGDVKVLRLIHYPGAEDRTGLPGKRN